MHAHAQGTYSYTLACVQAVYGGNAVLCGRAVAAVDINPVLLLPPHPSLRARLSPNTHTSSAQKPAPPPQVVLSFLRDVGGAALLLLAAAHAGALVRPRREDAGAFVALGVLGVYIGQMFMVLAMKYVSSLAAALPQPIQPARFAASCMKICAQPRTLYHAHRSSPPPSARARASSHCAPPRAQARRAIVGLVLA